MKRSLRMLALFSALFAIVSLMVCSPAFAVCFETEIGKIADRMGKGETAAVSPVYEEKSGDITALGDRWRTRPKIKAHMDRKPACYPLGIPAVIAVETEPGVHLYILGVAADHTVALFYPNSRMSDQPLPSGNFRFPPLALAGDVQLVFYPMKEDELCHESIKVIAGRKPIDFSFLPIPEDQVYAGARGGDWGSYAGTVGRPIATGTRPATGTTTSVFVLLFPQLTGPRADAGPLTLRKSCPRRRRGKKWCSVSGLVAALDDVAKVPAWERAGDDYVASGKR